MTSFTDHQPAEPADELFYNGCIYTVDSCRTVASAMAIKGDRIVYIGDDNGSHNWKGDHTRTVDLEKKLVLPGFVDSHNHAVDAVGAIYELWLHGYSSVPDYLRAIDKHASSHPRIKALRGSGWVNAFFDPHGPTAAMLDTVTAGIPALIYSQDYHSAWVNSEALARAGITSGTPDPGGGFIERDEHGMPTGTLRETAMELVESILPAYSQDQLKEGLQHFQSEAHSYGVTTVYIPSIKDDEMDALLDLQESGRLAVRFRAGLEVKPKDDEACIQEMLGKRKERQGAFFKIIGAKLFMDGVLEGGTAFLEKPYSHRPGWSGESRWEAQKYKQMCTALEKVGFQIHVHSIGDAATRLTLDGLSYARQQNGARDTRHLITHLQLVNAEDIDRFAELKVIAVPQPFWFVVDANYDQAVRYIGRRRANRQYPMKSFFDRGVIVASASDYNVTIPWNPMLAVEAGITRRAPRDGAGLVNPDFTRALNPAESVSVEQMIASFTIHGALATFTERETGSLEIGKKGDFVVLDQNILLVDPSNIHRTQVLLTYFSGKEVFRHASFPDQGG